MAKTKKERAVANRASWRYLRDASVIAPLCALPVAMLLFGGIFLAMGHSNNPHISIWTGAWIDGGQNWVGWLAIPFGIVMAFVWAVVAILPTYNEVDSLSNIFGDGLDGFPEDEREVNVEDINRWDEWGRDWKKARKQVFHDQTKQEG